MPVGVGTTNKEEAAEANRVPRRRGRPPGATTWTVDNPPEHVRRFIQWYVFDRRYKETLADYANTTHGHYQNLVRMLRDPRVSQLLEVALRDSNAGPTRIQEVLDMLHHRAVHEDDIKAARIYLEAVGKMAPRQSQVDVRITDARGLSNDQLQVELRRALALLQGQHEAEEIEEAEVVEDTQDDNVLDIPG
jgi:hypothetical protein